MKNNHVLSIQDCHWRIFYLFSVPLFLNKYNVSRRLADIHNNDFCLEIVVDKRIIIKIAACGNPAYIFKNTFKSYLLYIPLILFNVGHRKITYMDETKFSEVYSTGYFGDKYVSEMGSIIGRGCT